MPRPVVVGGRKGFCSRAIPGPGPSQSPALCGRGPAKCSSASASSWCEGGTPLGAFVLVRANLPPPALPLWTKKLSTSAALPWATSLSSLPCWVVPPSKASSPAGGPARFCCLHSKVRLRRVIPGRYSSTPLPG